MAGEDALHGCCEIWQHSLGESLVGFALDLRSRTAVKSADVSTQDCRIAAWQLRAFAAGSANGWHTTIG